MEVIYASTRNLSAPGRHRVIALPNLDVSQPPTSYHNYSPGTSLIFNGHDRRINQSLSPDGVESQYLYGHLQANLRHMPLLPDRNTMSKVATAPRDTGEDDNMRDGAKLIDDTNKVLPYTYSSRPESAVVSVREHHHDVLHSPTSHSVAPRARRPTSPPPSRFSEFEEMPKQSSSRHFSGYPQRPVRFVHDYYNKGSTAEMSMYPDARERHHREHYGYVPEGPGAWQAHHSYLRSLDEPSQEARISDDTYEQRSDSHQLPALHSTRHDADEPSSAHGPDPDLPLAQRQQQPPPLTTSLSTARFSPYHTAQHSSTRYPMALTAKREQGDRVQHHQQREQQQYVGRASLLPLARGTATTTAGTSSTAGAPRGNSRDRPIYPSTLAPRPPSSNHSGQYRPLHPFPAPVSVTRPNNGASRAQGHADPVYELAPVNYKMIYDYALDIRECLVRSKPEMLDKFLYSAEILCKVFTGCRVGYDFAYEPQQPAPPPQQLRCTSCNIVKTPEWRKGPLVWGKMSRDRAAKAKAKAEAAFKAKNVANANSTSNAGTAATSVPSVPSHLSAVPTFLVSTQIHRPINTDSLTSSAHPVAVSLSVSAKVMPVASPNSTQGTSKHGRESSLDSGNESDREDNSGSGDRRSDQHSVRTQLPSRPAQKRRFITDPQEQNPRPLASHKEDEYKSGDEEPLPDLVRYVGKTGSTASVPETAATVDGGTRKKVALKSEPEADTRRPSNMATGTQTAKEPPAIPHPSVPSLSFVSRRVYVGPVTLAEPISDEPVVTDMVRSKTDTMVERIVMQPSETQQRVSE
ncbi:hypothetical protein BGW42_008734 [Actinomortierella wolfii]|nr:hypothetical protein BGW42_008734 [Actinomortierella wolfii]